MYLWALLVQVVEVEDESSEEESSDEEAAAPVVVNGKGKKVRCLPTCKLAPYHMCVAVFRPSGMRAPWACSAPCHTPARVFGIQHWQQLGHKHV
jgi:hypothetical protein